MWKFFIYKDACGEWRWRLFARNGRCVADSGEGYSSRTGVLDAVERMRQHTPR